MTGAFLWVWVGVCLVGCTWAYLTMFRKAFGWDSAVAAHVAAELRPFGFWCFELAALGAFHRSDSVAFRAFLVASMVAAVYVRRIDKDDDDRWGRRRRKAAQKVAELAGRLVVVPTASGGAA